MPSSEELVRQKIDKVLTDCGWILQNCSKISMGDKESRSKDILGGLYGYFLSHSAGAEGKIGVQICTRQELVPLSSL